MTAIVLPAPSRVELPRIVLPSYEQLGERLRLPRWARPWERTKEDTYVAAIGLAQHTSQDAGSPVGASTTLAFGSNNTAGGLLIAVCRVGLQNHTITVSDNNGNTWQSAVASFNDGVPADTYGIFYAENCNAGANTLTFSHSPVATTTMRWCIAEYSGVATSGSLDQHTSAVGTSTSPSSGNVTPSVNNELCIGLIGDQTGTTITSGGTMAKEEEQPAGATARLVFQDVVQGTAAAVAASATLGASQAWAAAIATFKPAAVAGGSQPRVIVSREAQRRASRW